MRPLRRQIPVDVGGPGLGVRQLLAKMDVRASKGLWVMEGVAATLEYVV